MSVWGNLDPKCVAFVGDLHGNTERACNAVDWAAEQGAEAIIQVGDFAYDFHPWFLLKLQKTLENAGIHLGYVPGNHEDYRKLDAWQAEHGCTAIPVRPNIHYLPRTYRWEWSGIRFLAMGGAVSVDKTWRTPGVEWWPRETIDWHEAQKACDDGLTDVLISCPPVSGSPASRTTPQDSPPTRWPKPTSIAGYCGKSLTRCSRSISMQGTITAVSPTPCTAMATEPK
jgi:predicted phosphodiesterase